MRTHIIATIIILYATTAFCGENDVVPPGDDPSRTVVIASVAKFLNGLSPDVQRKGDIRVKVDDVLGMMARNEQFTFIDVRTPQEQTIVAIPGSLAISIDKLMEHLDRIPRDHKVVLVCHSGPRSVIGATALRILGYGNVYALNGGIHALSDVTAKTAPNSVASSKDSAAFTSPEKLPRKNKPVEEEYSELGGNDFSCD